MQKLRQGDWSIAFVVWLTHERHLTLFPAGTIVKDPHHRESRSRPLPVFKKAFYEVKASGQHFSFTIFGRPRIEHPVKTNYITFQPVNPETCSILIFYKRVWDYFSTIICVLFVKKNIYILLTDQFSLYSCL